jgi:hypothetical protein
MHEIVDVESGSAEPESFESKIHKEIELIRKQVLLSLIFGILSLFVSFSIGLKLVF